MATIYRDSKKQIGTQAPKVAAQSSTGDDHPNLVLSTYVQSWAVWFVDCPTDSKRGWGSRKSPQYISKESVKQFWLPLQPVKKKATFQITRFACKVRVLLPYLKKKDEPNILEQTRCHVSRYKGFPIQNQAVRSDSSLEGEQNKGLKFGCTFRGSKKVSINASIRELYFAITTQRA